MVHSMVSPSLYSVLLGVRVYPGSKLGVVESSIGAWVVVEVVEVVDPGVPGVPPGKPV